MNSDLSAQRNLGLNLVSFTIQVCPIFGTVVFMPNVSMAFLPTFQGFARERILALNLNRSTDVQIYGKVSNEALNPLSCKTLVIGCGYCVRSLILLLFFVP